MSSGSKQIFVLLDKPSRAEHCKAMEGLVAEGSDLLEEEGSPIVKDAALIGAAQRVEHYEIAAYGTTRALAELLELNEAVELLQQTLDEEKETDEKLTEFAQVKSNMKRRHPKAARAARPSAVAVTAETSNGLRRFRLKARN